MVGVAIGVGAAASVGGAAIGAGAAKKAAKTQARASDNNNALQREIYQSNKETLAPFVAQGGKATTAINSLLGLGGTGSDSLDNVDWNSYVQANPDALNQWQTDAQARAMFGGDIGKFGAFHYQNDGARRDLTAFQGNGNAGFDAFRNSTGYQFRLNEGQKAVQAALGARGLLDSGAALKSLTNYAQGAASDEFARYYGALTGQQQVGLGAASAQAGVGTGYANAVSANNNTAAQTSGNAALASSGQISSALGNVSNLAALGSSYSGSGGGAINSGAYGWSPIGQTPSWMNVPQSGAL